MEQVILEVMPRHVEKNKVIGSSHHGFTKGNLCSTDLLNFCGGLAGWASEGRAVDAVCLDFSKAFDTVSHNILAGKLRKCGLEEWTVRWIRNWLNGRALRVMISRTESTWRPTASGILQGSLLDQYRSICLSMTQMEG
ncbi:hypothetical protein DUI87_03708 [Hirundo rustica rustica]|uniref:Reverse transcriptase domain-containing protein n=1 Tax=Hirundo rustica rustica TaxID=333673 RepID=A0A3M0L5A8_HIRRU|nr:hypothetical protein DUI87_03708 [Hirundo rustica rustica]